MSITAISIKRPVTVLMVFVGVILFGFISVGFLRQELFPPVVYPKLTVVTHYANAAPEEIENLITKSIEEAVGSTPGLRDVTSISREGLSLVIAEFGWNQNMDFAALGVREKIDLIKARLPRDAEEPTVVKFNPFELPVITLSVSSEARTPVQLKRFSSRWIKDELEKINGVASATISGGADEEILVSVDQGRLKASELGILDIQKAISESNLNYPGGTIKENFYEYLVRTIGEFEKIDEIGKIAVAREEKKGENQFEAEVEIPTNDLVLLKDVAEIKRQTKERTSYSRYNGLENLTVSIQKQAGSNTIQVVKDIKKRLKELERQMPKDIQVDIIYNQAKFIKEAIHGVKNAAIQGGILAFFVLLIFLKNLRSALLIIIIIPITVLATLTLMYFTGISLNVISLGGIALAVGMLVDAAIVVIENVVRFTEKKIHNDVASNALHGTLEVIPPLIASTLTTVMVFLPMIFVTGIAGQIFKELAWVVIVTQLFSLLVAFTLLPMLIVQFEKFKDRKDAFSLFTMPTFIKKSLWKFIDIAGSPFEAMEKKYHAALPAFLEHKKKFLFIIFVLFLGSLMLLSGYERIVMPRVDQGQFMVKLDMPVGTRLERTHHSAMVMERYLRQQPVVKNVSLVVGSTKGDSNKDLVQQIASHQSRLIITLDEKRDISTSDFLQAIRKDIESPEFKKAMGRPKISYVPYESAFNVGGDSSAPVMIDISGNDLDVLKTTALEIQKKMKSVNGLYDISNTVSESAPETKIIVDKDKAAFYRLSVTDLATAAHISIKGTVASKFKEESKEIDIRVVLQEKHRSAISELPFIQMHSPLGMNVPLSEVVEFKTGRGPSEIKRHSQERTVQVLAKVFERSLNDVTADVQKILDQSEIPYGYTAHIAGESQEVQESFNSLKLALLLSIILIYMIMAAQFESYSQPFIIMFTLPLSMIGVALALGISGTAISVVVILGIILLGGIVVNNGIILIDFINQKVRNGSSVVEAVEASGKARFRPIVITAMTTILGLLPLALGLGEGSKLQSPMAITVMGGLLVATFLTLLVVPAIYAGAHGRKKKS